MALNMKRISLSFISIVILGCIAGYAQSANRKGLILELRGGQTMGYVYKNGHLDVYKAYMKGGFDMGLGVGYRFATSTSWAFQAKIDLSCNLSAPSRYLDCLFSSSAVVGVRWFSADFAGNKSVYIGAGTGLGIHPFSDGMATYIPVEVEAGINLTNKFSVGVYALPKIQVNEANMHHVYVHGNGVNLKYESNASLGIKLGYRF